MKTVLFVCTVNRWRSPMAEHLFRNMLEKKNSDVHKQIMITSAGIVPSEEKAKLIKNGIGLPDPLFGYRPLPCVIFYLMKRGIDSSMHRSRELSEEIMDNADLVISVTDKHKDWIIKIYPSKKEKIFGLEELSRPLRLPLITDEPPGLFPPDKFCMFECNHWESTDRVMSIIEERLDEAMNRILGLLNAKI